MTVKTAATANWYGNSGTPPPDVLDVVLVEVEEDEAETLVVDVDAVVTEVELIEVEEDEAETLVVDVDAVVTEEPPYCRTLAAAQSETQRLPLESNAIP
jgi:hypothetical protein